MADFFSRLDEVCSVKNTLLCVGLDPRLASRPQSVRRTTMDHGTYDSIRQAIVSANRRLIERTLPFAAAYKPNMAFYEAWGSHGFSALEETIRLIPSDVPIILDAKRNDIGPTASAYAQSTFEYFDADAVTLSPYMGKDAIDPFLDYKDKGIFVVCRTSNPAAGKLQDIVDQETGELLYLRVAREIVSWSPQIGLVVAGNDVEALRQVRSAHPDVWFLSPGIGAQGGSATQAVQTGRRVDGLGVLVVVGRSVADADDPGEAARAFRDQINEGRREVTGRGAEFGKTTHQTVTAQPTPAAPRVAVSAPAPETPRDDFGEPGGAAARQKKMVLHGLVRTGCFRVGDFVLKSGIHSPFYIDLRRTVSDPVFLKLVAQAYVEISRELDFSRIAGIPVAALPFATAVSLETGVPMIYPRIPLKEHGTGNRIEGEFQPGERVLLLDDLITTGLSKVEAAEILRAEGLEVVDLVVLLERSRTGRSDMESAGIRLHAYAHISELFATCREMGVIDQAQELLMRQFIESGN